MIDLVKVTYRDLAEQDDVEVIESVNLKEMEIFGYLYEDKKVIRIVKEFDISDESGHQVMVIPKSVVISIEKLKVGVKKKWK